MTNNENETQLMKFLFDQRQKSSYAKRYIVLRDICFAKSEQCYHLTSTDAEAVAVRLVDALATSQEEAGARIILQYMHICETAPNITHI